MDGQYLKPKYEHGDRVIETANDIYAEVLHRKLQNKWTDEEMDLLILTTIGLLDLVKHVWQYEDILKVDKVNELMNKFDNHQLK